MRRRIIIRNLKLRTRSTRWPFVQFLKSANATGSWQRKNNSNQIESISRQFPLALSHRMRNVPPSAMNVLVLQLKRIGDLVLTTPALAALHAGGAKITLVVENSCASLLPAIPGVAE